MVGIDREIDDTERRKRVLLKFTIDLDINYNYLCPFWTDS